MSDVGASEALQGIGTIPGEPDAGGAIVLDTSVLLYWTLSPERLSVATAVAGAALEWEHRDPADRWITAFAAEHDAALVTSDERIRAFYPAAVW